MSIYLLFLKNVAKVVKTEDSTKEIRKFFYCNVKVHPNFDKVKVTKKRVQNKKNYSFFMPS